MTVAPSENLARDALVRLEADGLVQQVGVDGRYRTTRRWQGTMARTALRLLRAGDDSGDLRVPIAHALVELYGADVDDDALVNLVEAMLPIETAELEPRLAFSQP